MNYKHFENDFWEGVSMGILVPILIFFGLTVVFAGMVSEMAIKSIEHKRSPE